jgi:hypothetical protein
MGKPLARPIKTARDHKAAAAIARKAKQADVEPAAERRLQALLSEIDKFDNDPEDELEADAAEEMESEFRRRWSDDA